MGLKIRVSEVSHYLSELTASLERRNASLDSVSRQLDGFIAAPELKGGSWRAAKAYAEGVHAPIIKGHTLANDAVIHDNSRFSARMGSLIDNEEIDEDALLLRSRPSSGKTSRSCGGTRCC